MRDARWRRFDKSSETPLQAEAMGERSISPSVLPTPVLLSHSASSMASVSPAALEQAVPGNERSSSQQRVAFSPRAILNGILVRSVLIQEWVEGSSGSDSAAMTGTREATLAQMAREFLQSSTYPEMDSLTNREQAELLGPIMERVQPALEAIEKSGVAMAVFHGRVIQQVSTPVAREKEVLENVEQTNRLTQHFATALVTLSEMKKRKAP